MAIRALNHAVLYVRDASRSAAFYRDVLGFRTISDMGGRAVFMQAPDSDNDHDLGLFSIGDDASPSPAGQGSVGLYHLAWEVGTLADLVALRDRLAEVGALVGSSDHGTTKSLYAKDPDGIEFEVAWLLPHELITEQDRAAQATIGRLDLDAEVARFGPDTAGATS